MNLFQKRVVRTKFDIYDFIILFIVNSVDQNSSLKVRNLYSIASCTFW
jgi:hypothetical protein